MIIPTSINLSGKDLITHQATFCAVMAAAPDTTSVFAYSRSRIEIGSPLFEESIKELNYRKEELAAKMNESQMGKILFGSACGMIGAGQVFATAANTLVGIVSAIPIVANAIHAASQIERPENIFDQSGMKYLALLDKQVRRKSILKAGK